ncbi:MAG: hypothetical protein R3F55_00445 [Alphaproteobacteria bacterium]
MANSNRPPPAAAARPAGRLGRARRCLADSRRRLRDLDAIGDGTFLAFYDFSYAPYALGDAMTFQAKAMCGAIDAGCDSIRLCLVADPNRPACPLQPHITAGNYLDHLNRLYPAFLCTPPADRVHVFRSRQAFDLFVLHARRRGTPSWPALGSHFERRLDFISHAEIDAFFARHGHVPRLAAPRGHGTEALLAAAGCGRYVVAVNVRQSRMTARPADFHRDSPAAPWHRLFAHAAARHPEVLFACLGGFGEWDRALAAHTNVVVPRAMGLQLADELALLFGADLFMGSSSGFAAAATFSDVPYAITNMEHRFAAYNGLAVGAPRYAFGLPGQRIGWEVETDDLLIGLFEEAHARGPRPRADVAPTAASGRGAPALAAVAP